MEKKEKSKPRPVLVIIVVLFSLCCICMIVGTIGSAVIDASPSGKATNTAAAILTQTEAARPTETPPPTNTPAPPTVTPTPAPPTNTPLPTNTLSPEGAVQNAIDQALVKSNRDLQRITDTNITCTDIGCSAVVEFTLNDNLTANLRVGEAMRDTTELLEAIANSGTPIINVRLKGTFSMVDEYGNVSESVVVNVLFKSETIEKINWENFFWDNIYMIADDAQVHPEFRPEP